MMPRDGESPPHERAKNRLPDGERKNITFFPEQPSHQRAPNQSNRHEDRIRPVERGEEKTRDERNTHRAVECSEEAIGDKRIQSDLLQQTEEQVAEETTGKEDGTKCLVLAAKKKSRNHNCQGAGKEDRRSAFRGAP